MKGRGGRWRAWRLTRRAPSGTRKAPPMSGGGGTSGAGGERRLRRGSGAGRTKKAGHVEGAPAGVRRRSDGRHVGTPPPRIRHGRTCRVGHEGKPPPTSGRRPDTGGGHGGTAPPRARRVRGGHRARLPPTVRRSPRTAEAGTRTSPARTRRKNGRTDGYERRLHPHPPQDGRPAGRGKSPRTRAKPDVTSRVRARGACRARVRRTADVRWWPPVPSHPSPRGSARRRRHRRRPRRSAPRRGPARRARPGRHG